MCLCVFLSLKTGVSFNARPSKLTELSCGSCFIHQTFSALLLMCFFKKRLLGEVSLSDFSTLSVLATQIPVSVGIKYVLQPDGLDPLKSWQDKSEEFAK